MNSIKTIFEIGIVAKLLILTACTRIIPETDLVITTDDIGIFTEGIYVFKGDVVIMGSEQITDHGFCWSASASPETEENQIHLGTMTYPGPFSTRVSGLSTKTTYYVRSFAKAGAITYYGEERSFNTPDTFRLMLMDIDQNIYRTIKIGDQIWMADNLNVKRYPDGTRIRLVEDKKTWYDFAMYTPAYCWYDNYEATGSVYGALYTWPAAMYVTEAVTNDEGIQGVCPDGWHLPSDREWKQLEMYLGMNRRDADTTGWRGTDEGGKLKSAGTVYWTGPNTGTNEAGFNAYGGGWRYGAGYDKDFGKSAMFWSSTMVADLGIMRRLDNNSSRIYRNFTGLYEGHSVRCVKDK